MKAKIIVIDIGSTTTKGLLLEKKGEVYTKSALVHFPTTVEKPVEDVMIGLSNTISKLEELSGLQLWQNSDNGILAEDTGLYCTSSAGGGLQILVIGLTTFDSAASGKRCAYGAGAVILDTFAINDKRSAVQQMKAMARLHPDLILMTGGTDGGAVAPVVRLAELIQFANPRAKFSETPIPLIFAGNVQAQDLISGILKKRFQLHLIDNVRPDMKTENHKPARDLIHELFMNYVMEQAPGYSKVVKKVDDDIIPTPLGVLKSIELLHEQKEGDVMMVDIGGATTDVFSNMHGEFYRTVSANYGMSYSISNVYKDIGWDVIAKDLPKGTDADHVMDYIADKMLFPTCNPGSALHCMIEHILARAALYLAREQHLEMNFNTDKIGFLDKLVNHKNVESIVDKFYFKAEKKEERFFLHDYLYAIGAGGVISHTQNNEQALMLIADGLKMQGLTLIYRDEDFTSPHLGKLSQVNKDQASRLLEKECLQELGWHLRPQGVKWKAGMAVMKIKYNDQNIIITTGKKYLIKNSVETDYNITLAKNFMLNDREDQINLKTALPLYIDTTHASLENDHSAFHQLYDLKTKVPDLGDVFPLKTMHFKPEHGRYSRKIIMPYTGDIKVKEGEKVTTERIIAENRSNPPRLYIITLFDRNNLGLDKENIRESLLISEGDIVKTGQKIVDRKKLSLKEQMQGMARTFESPLRGLVENINYESGTIILREVQDYSDKPIKVKITDRLGIKPKQIIGYLKVHEGDFVYSGDLLAAIRLDRANLNKSAMMDKMITQKPASLDTDMPDSGNYNSILAPATGSIRNIDPVKGTLTIEYDRKPLLHYSGVNGTVTEVKDDLEINIDYEGWNAQGIIGFGRQKPGVITFSNELNIPPDVTENSILVVTAPIDIEFLNKAAAAGIGGLIVPSIHYKDLSTYINEDIGVALTGNENIPFPLIIMQGFGEYPLSAPLTEFFKNHNGCQCFIDGHTQIRAGVTRPLIIIQEN